MGLLDSLGRIVEAPVHILDATVAKPVADAAQEVADAVDDALGGGC